MAGVNDFIHYVRQVQEPFDLRPLTDVDLLVFSALAYMEFEATSLGEACRAGVGGSRAGAGQDDSPCIGDLARYAPLERYACNDYRPQAMTQLLEAMVASPRFAPVAIRDFTCVETLDPPVQFAGLVLGLPGPDPVVVALRGTNGFRAGWEENLCMMYETQAPGCDLAQDFIARAVKANPQVQVVLTGHSKGGSWAEQASLRTGGFDGGVSRVVTFDAPGPFRAGAGDGPEVRAYDAQMAAWLEEPGFDLRHYLLSAQYGAYFQPDAVDRSAVGADADSSCSVTPGTGGSAADAALLQSQPWPIIQCVRQGSISHNVGNAKICDGEFDLADPTDPQVRKVAARRVATNRAYRSLTRQEREAIPPFVMGALGKVGFRMGFSDPLWPAVRAVAYDFLHVSGSTRRLLCRAVVHGIRGYLGK